MAELDEIMIIETENETLREFPANMISAAQGEELPVDINDVKLAINGDKDAFSRLFMCTYKSVFCIMRGYLSRDEDICDAVQDTYTKVYANLKSLRSPEAFYSWVMQIARNSAKDIIARNGSVTLSSEVCETYDEPSDSFDKRDISLDVTAALEQLPPDQATLLARVYYDGMRISEIAKMQGKPASTVYSRFYKAKRNLKALLRVRGIDKPIYAGSPIAMLTTILRNAIGTQLLSVAVAEEILKDVVKHKTPQNIVLEKLIKKNRDAAVLRVASIIVAISVIASSGTVLLLRGIAVPKVKVNKDFSSDVSSVYSQSSETGGGLLDLFSGSKGEQKKDNDKKDEDNHESSGIGSFWDSLFGRDEKGDEEKDNSHQTESNISSGTGSSSSVSGSAAASSKTSGTSSTVNSSSKVSSAISGSSSNSSVSTFVPDCDPSQYNTVGNEYQNTTFHGGYVAKQGDWLYYTGYGYGQTAIYKIKTDGTGKTKVSSSVAAPHPNINVVGEWIYFFSGQYSNVKYLARIKTDGSSYQRLTNIPGDNLQVFGNVGYFSSELEDDFTGKTTYAYYKYDFSTDTLTKLTDKYQFTETYMSDKYFICSYNYCTYVYDKATKALVKSFSDSSFYVYKNNLVINGFLYNLDNLSADGKKIGEYLHINYFSDYKGGVIGGVIEPLNEMQSDGTLYLSDLSFKDWPMAWGCDYCDYKYCTIDNYVYYVYKDELHRALPDGTDYTVLK